MKFSISFKLLLAILWHVIEAAVQLLHRGVGIYRDTANLSLAC